MTQIEAEAICAICAICGFGGLCRVVPKREKRRAESRQRQPAEQRLPLRRADAAEPPRAKPVRCQRSQRGQPARRQQQQAKSSFCQGAVQVH